MLFVGGEAIVLSLAIVVLARGGVEIVDTIHDAVDCGIGSKTVSNRERERRGVTCWWKNRCAGWSSSVQQWGKWPDHWVVQCGWPCLESSVKDGEAVVIEGKNCWVMFEEIEGAADD